MEKKDAIKKMRKGARSIFTDSCAIEIAGAFGVDKKHLPIRHWTAEGGIHVGANVYRDGLGLGSPLLSAIISAKYASVCVESGPYIGRGKNAEFITLKNCDIIEEKMNS